MLTRILSRRSFNFTAIVPTRKAAVEKLAESKGIQLDDNQMSLLTQRI